MWKRDDRRQSDLQDAVNRTRDELRRFAPESIEPPPPEIDHGAVAANVATTLDSAPRPHPAPTPDTAMPPDTARIGLHPFLQGLLEILPEPGDDWPNVKREQWLETARNIFALIYDQNSGLRE